MLASRCFLAGQPRIAPISATMIAAEKLLLHKKTDDRQVNLNVAKAGGFQSPGVKGEAVLDYRNPLTTQDLMSSDFPEAVNNMANSTSSFEFTTCDIPQIVFSL